jgi:hypothetical protein
MWKIFLNRHKDKRVRRKYTANYNKRLYNYLSIYDIIRNGIIKLHKPVNYIHQNIFPSCYQNSI